MGLRQLGARKFAGFRPAPTKSEFFAFRHPVCASLTASFTAVCPFGLSQGGKSAPPWMQLARSSWLNTGFYGHTSHERVRPAILRSWSAWVARVKCRGVPIDFLWAGEG